MVKRNILIFLCFQILLIAGCSEKYSDAVDVNRDFITVMGNYVNRLDAAGSAKEVAAAMDEFAAAMTTLGPRMREINDKYPELKDENNQPEVLKKIQKESEDMQERFSASFMKTMQYMKDPEVQQSHQRIVSAMRAMAK